jgi:hypothetical protein
MEVGGNVTTRPLHVWKKCDTYYMEVWVGPRAVLEGAKNVTLPRFKPRTIQPVANRYTGYALPAHRL